MKAIIPSFSKAFYYLKSDRPTLILSFFPPTVGVILYLLFGKWFFSFTTEYGQRWIKVLTGDGAFGAFFYYLFVTLLTVALFFIVNWTFVLVVSLIASPFNDAISARIEKLEQGKKPDSLEKTFKRMLSYGFFVVINEAKKISFVLGLTLLSLIFHFFPLFSPLSFIISALLLAVQFLDYNWVRHDQKFHDCFVELKQNFLTYLIPGSAVLLLMAIPVINLLAIPFSVIYFSLLWVQVGALKIEALKNLN